LRSWIGSDLIIEREGRLYATDALEEALRFVEGLGNRMVMQRLSKSMRVYSEYYARLIQPFELSWFVSAAFFGTNVKTTLFELRLWPCDWHLGALLGDLCVRYRSSGSIRNSSSETGGSWLSFWMLDSRRRRASWDWTGFWVPSMRIIAARAWHTPV
jgi:hypothetical protein